MGRSRKQTANENKLQSPPPRLTDDEPTFQHMIGCPTLTHPSGAEANPRRDVAPSKPSNLAEVAIQTSGGKNNSSRTISSATTPRRGHKITHHLSRVPPIDRINDSFYNSEEDDDAVGRAAAAEEGYSHMSSLSSAASERLRIEQQTPSDAIKSYLKDSLMNTASWLIWSLLDLAVLLSMAAFLESGDVFAGVATAMTITSMTALSVANGMGSALDCLISNEFGANRYSPALSKYLQASTAVNLVFFVPVAIFFMLVPHSWVEGVFSHANADMLDAIVLWFRLSPLIVTPQLISLGLQKFAICQNKALLVTRSASVSLAVLPLLLWWACYNGSVIAFAMAIAIDKSVYLGVLVANTLYDDELRANLWGNGLVAAKHRRRMVLAARELRRGSQSSSSGGRVGVYVGDTDDDDDDATDMVDYDELLSGGDDGAEEGPNNGAGSAMTMPAFGFTDSDGSSPSSRAQHNTRPYSDPHVARPFWFYVYDYLVTGSASCASFCIDVWTFELMTIVAARCGPTEASAWVLMQQLTVPLFAMANGLSMTAATDVGQAHGAGCGTGIIARRVHIAMVSSVAAGVLAAAAVYLLGPIVYPMMIEVASKGHSHNNHNNGGGGSDHSTVNTAALEHHTKATKVPKGGNNFRAPMTTTTALVGGSGHAKEHYSATMASLIGLEALPLYAIHYIADLPFYTLQGVYRGLHRQGVMAQFVFVALWLIAVPLAFWWPSRWGGLVDPKDLTAIHVARERVKDLFGGGKGSVGSGDSTPTQVGGCVHGIVVALLIGSSVGAVLLYRYLIQVLGALQMREVMEGRLFSAPLPEEGGVEGGLTAQLLRSASAINMMAAGITIAGGGGNNLKGGEASGMKRNITDEIFDRGNSEIVFADRRVFVGATAVAPNTLVVEPAIGAPCGAAGGGIVPPHLEGGDGPQAAPLPSSPFQAAVDAVVGGVTSTMATIGSHAETLSRM